VKVIIEQAPKGGPLYGLRRGLGHGEGSAVDALKDCRCQDRPSSCGGGNAARSVARRCVREGRPLSHPERCDRCTRHRATAARVAIVIASSSRAISDVAREFGVCGSPRTTLIAAAAKWLPEPTPTSSLGIDETRFRSVRWILDGITRRRSDPWLTSLVDCSVDGLGIAVGLAPAVPKPVSGVMSEQSEAFREMIQRKASGSRYSSFPQ
jgi:hypothetical protein